MLWLKKYIKKERKEKFRDISAAAATKYEGHK